MKMTLGIKIFAGYAVAFLAIVVLSTTSYLTVRYLEDNFHEAQSERDFIGQLDAFHDFIFEAQDGQRAFLLAAKQGNLAKLDNAIAETGGKIQALRAAPAAKGRDSEITQIESLVKPLILQLKSETVDRGAVALGEKVDASTRAMDQFVVAIEHLKSLESAEFEAVDKGVGDLALQLERTVLFGSLLALVVVALVGLIVSRNITAPLLRIDSAAGRMAGGDFTVSLGDTSRGDEIGSLSRSFSAMVGALTDLVAQVQRSGLQVNS